MKGRMFLLLIIALLATIVLAVPIVSANQMAPAQATMTSPAIVTAAAHVPCLDIATTTTHAERFAAQTVGIGMSTFEAVTDIAKLGTTATTKTGGGPSGYDIVAIPSRITIADRGYFRSTHQFSAQPTIT